MRKILDIDKLIGDLRFGNVIRHVYSDYPNRITGIKSHCIWLDCMVSHCDFSTDDVNDGIDGLFPESLSKEWLRKFGCLKVNNSMYRIENMTFQPYTNLTTFKGGWKFCLNGKFIKVIYDVHDFQNTYRWIMGCEAIIKQQPNA